MDFGVLGYLLSGEKGRGGSEGKSEGMLLSISARLCGGKKCDVSTQVNRVVANITLVPPFIDKVTIDCSAKFFDLRSELFLEIFSQPIRYTSFWLEGYILVGFH